MSQSQGKRTNSKGRGKKSYNKQMDNELEDPTPVPTRTPLKTVTKTMSMAQTIPGPEFRSTKEYIENFFVTRKFRDSDLIPDLNADDAKTVHEALIDAEDENAMIGEVDSNIRLADAAIESGNDSKLRAGYEKNKLYIEQAALVQKAYPFANLVPQDSAPIHRIMQRIKKIRKKSKPTGTSRVISRYRATCRTRASRIYGRAQTLKTIAKDDKISISQQGKRVQQHVVEEMAENMAIASLLKSSATDKKQFKEEMTSYYYLPKNCTMRAMKALIADAVTFANDPLSKYTRYHLPSRLAMSEVCLEGNFGSLEELEASLETGTMLKTMKAIKIKSKSDAGFERSQAPFEINEYYNQRDTTLAKDMIDADDGLNEIDVDDELLGEYQTPVTDEDVFFEKEIEGGLEELKEVYETEGDVAHIRPFVYSMGYTYKIIFQVYLNRHGYKLPFGKTIPSLPWLYVFSYYLDPENALGLRMSRDRYMFSVGGVGLLEKDLVKDMPVDRHVYQLFKPSMSASGDVTVFKNAVVSVYTLLIRLKSCIDSLCELKDIKEELKFDISNSVEQMHNVTKTVGISEDHDIAGIITGATTIADRIFNPSTDEDDLERLLFEIHQAEYSGKRSKLADAMAPLSYDSAFMASTMAKFAYDWDNGTELSKAWYVKGVLNSGKPQNAFFDLVSEMLMDSGFNAMTALLFGNKAVAQKARSCVAKARDIIRDNGQELMSIVCSDSFSTKAELSWTSTFTSQAIAQNKTLSSIVKMNLDDTLQEVGEFNLDTSMVIATDANDLETNLVKRYSLDDHLESTPNVILRLSEVKNITHSGFAKYVRKINDLEEYNKKLTESVSTLTKANLRVYRKTLAELTIDFIASIDSDLRLDDDFIALSTNKEDNLRALLAKRARLKARLTKFAEVLKSSEKKNTPAVLIARRMIKILNATLNL